MDDISGAVRVLAKARVKGLEHKPFLGKPYVRIGQAVALWGYFLQLGVVLGARHANRLDALGHALLGMKGPPGAVEKYFRETALDDFRTNVHADTTFLSYVLAESKRRLAYSGDPSDMLLKLKDTKLSPDTVAEVGWQFALNGAALGSTYPQEMRAVFERTHSPISSASWDRARQSGVNLPAEQDRSRYDEVERDENEMFMHYCRECCPEHHTILNA